METLVARDRVVTLELRLTVDGEVIEEVPAGDPLVYLHGHGMLVAGLERALEGRAVGERLELSLAPEDGYGPSDPERVEVVSRADFPPEVEIAVGQQFGATDQDGEEVVVWITAVEGERVTINGNHPLAGETLEFQERVLDVRPASEEELSHGHPHVEGRPHP